MQSIFNNTVDPEVETEGDEEGDNEEEEDTQTPTRTKSRGSRGRGSRTLSSEVGTEGDDEEEDTQTPTRTKRKKSKSKGKSKTHSRGGSRCRTTGGRGTSSRSSCEEETATTARTPPRQYIVDLVSVPPGML